MVEQNAVTFVFGLIPLQKSFISVTFATVIVLGIIKPMVTTYLRGRKMPPGPTGLPLLGNALQVPTKLPWLRFTEWKEKYGTHRINMSVFLWALIGRYICYYLVQAQYSPLTWPVSL